MRSAKTSLLVIAALLAGLFLADKPAINAQPAIGGGIESFTQAMDRKLPDRMNSYGIPGVTIAVLHKGEIVWVQAYGIADRKSGRAMAEGDIFRVESISKSITAWGVMTLVEEGMIELDMPVATYLKSWSLPPSEISVDTLTVRQLLSHTGGMPLGNFGARYPPEGPVLALRDSLSKEARPIQQPGLSFSYSNTGYNLLELLIEDVSGMPFSDYMAREILTPLGMMNSSFEWSPEINDRIPTAYGLKEEPVPLYIYPGRGAGGLFATVEDIARFIQAGMAEGYRSEHKVLSPASIELISTPQAKPGGLMAYVSDAYGFGVFLEELQAGRHAVWNGGQGSGWMAHFYAVPDAGDAIVILVNSQRAWPLFAEVMREWSKWAGIAPVGMAHLTTVIFVLQVAIGLLIIASLGQILRIGRGLVMNQRSFAPLANEAWTVRLLQGLSATFLFSVLVWERSQDYLFLWSIIPHVFSWFEFAILVAAVALAVTAAVPRAGSICR